MTVSVCNETDQPRRGRVVWRLLKNDLTVVDSGEFAVDSPAFSAMDVGVCDFTHLTDAQRRTHVVEATLYDEDGWLMTDEVIRFVKSKDFEYLKPTYTLTLENGVLQIGADVFVDGVWLEFNKADCRFSYNGFSLTGDDLYLVMRHVEGEPTLEDLTILSLNDTM